MILYDAKTSTIYLKQRAPDGQEYIVALIIHDTSGKWHSITDNALAGFIKRRVARVIKQDCLNNVKRSAAAMVERLNERL